MSNKNKNKEKAIDPKPAAAKPDMYVVAEGLTITSKKGILSSGEELKKEFLSGGSDAFKRLVEAGYIVKG